MSSKELSEDLQPSVLRWETWAKNLSFLLNRYAHYANNKDM